jgi:hypothetical protein
VRRQGEQIHAERVDVDRQAAGRLRRVGVEADAGGAREPRGLADRLHGRDLVVRVLDRGNGHAWRAHGGREPVQIDAAVRIGIDQDRLHTRAEQGRARAERRGMLDGPGDHARSGIRSPGNARDGERDGLRTARREHDLVGLRAERPPDPGAGVLQRVARAAALGVDRQRVAEDVERGEHRLPRGGQQGSGAGRVEVQVTRHRGRARSRRAVTA